MQRIRGRWGLEHATAQLPVGWRAGISSRQAAANKFIIGVLFNCSDVQMILAGVRSQLADVGR